MAISIISNIAALKAQRQLNLSTDSVSKTFERLSSGLRINSAADDAAGLAIADSLRRDARLASMALRNASDAISATDLGIGALDAEINILTRMLELAQQSANSTTTQSQRSALANEFGALASEVQRIAQTTQFNGIPLLSDSRAIALQVGLTGRSDSTITLNPAYGTLQFAGLATQGGSLIYSIQAANASQSVAAAASAVPALKAAVDTITAEKTKLEGQQNRLNFAVDYLMVARENFVAAEGRIRDADAAVEVANLVKQQVVQQAATAIVAQANLQPEQALLLLATEQAGRKKST